MWNAFESCQWPPPPPHLLLPWKECKQHTKVETLSYVFLFVACFLARSFTRFACFAVPTYWLLSVCLSDCLSVVAAVVLVAVVWDVFFFYTCSAIVVAVIRDSLAFVKRLNTISCGGGVCNSFSPLPQTQQQRITPTQHNTTHTHVHTHNTDYPHTQFNDFFLSCTYFSQISQSYANYSHKLSTYFCKFSV